MMKYHLLFYVLFIFSSSVNADIQNSSLSSGILALIAIFVYILIRFRKWQFSTGAVFDLSGGRATY